jgi:antitoxin component YwqK of YwqJK toxin-antitoxin module
MRKLILILAVIFSSVSHSQSNQYKKNIKLAKDNFSKDDYKKTILFSIKSLNEKPNDFMALNLLQLSHNYLDEFDMSLEYGNQIVKLHSKQTDLNLRKLLAYAYFVQGLNFYFLDNKKNACNFFNSAILLEPNNPPMSLKQMKFAVELCSDEKKTTYYESGEIKEKANIIDGKLEGEALSYFESGEIEAKTNFVDGQQQGEIIKYYKSGEIKEKTNIVDGQPQGEAIQYFKSGEVKVNANFVDGKLEGEVIQYFESGEVKVNANFVDGKLEGKVTYYAKKGKIENIEYYKDGVLINNKN